MSDAAASTTAENEKPPGVPVSLDGAEILARPGELLIDAAERHGVYIPRFCYHPRMEPVGMCRMCLVDVDTGRGPALQPACMLTVAEGMKVETASERTKKAQDGVLEFLLINHPLDCPVCDKGGECPLQDQTLGYGPGESRFVEEKRHFAKPIAISSLVLLDRERCILCDRCTRFAKDVAGDPLIHFIDRGSSTQVNTFPDEPFS
jgi:NADH-quinone oxidoreductase subunit G